MKNDDHHLEKNDRPAARRRRQQLINAHAVSLLRAWRAYDWDPLTSKWRIGRRGPAISTDAASSRRFAPSFVLLMVLTGSRPETLARMAWHETGTELLRHDTITTRTAKNGRRSQNTRHKGGC